MALLMLLNVCAAEPVPDDELLARAESMAENIDIFAGSDEIQQCFGTPDMIRTVIAAWTEGDHRQPAAVYRLVLTEALLAEVMAIEPMTPMIATTLRQRAVTAVINAMITAFSERDVAASSITAISTGFAGDAGCSIYILCYDEGADVAVGFYPFGDGVSGAYAAFIPGSFEENYLESWQADVNVERVR